MQRKLLFAALCAVVLGGVTLIVWRCLAHRDPALPTARLDPLLKALLRESALHDGDHKSRFFVTLSALARKHGLSLKEYLPGPYIRVDEGRAAEIQAGNARYVAVILRGNSNFTLGEDVQYLLLFDQDGRLFDRLSCEINNRLTRMFADSGTFSTDVLATPEEDGARLVIRYIPEKGGSVSGNWSHTIVHGSQRLDYRWEQYGPGRISPAEWESKGLCRLAIRGGKFTILFPGPGQAATDR